jgi:hypothetical protein
MKKTARFAWAVLVMDPVKSEVIAEAAFDHDIIIE